MNCKSYNKLIVELLFYRTNKERIIMTDDHLLDIETKLSYQENLLDQLNSIIIKQQEELDVLKRALLTIQERVNSLNESSAENGDLYERPPHY